MEAIKQKFFMPIAPKEVNINNPYTWEDDYYSMFYYRLYSQALDVGYKGSFEEFRKNLSDFLINASSIATYEGSYNVTPLPFLEQILRTKQTVLEQDIVVDAIPYYETSNAAGGYTVIIGGD